MGADLRDFIDALEIKQPIVCGYDWGGRAACIVAALWPERVSGLVSMTGYNLQNIPASAGRRPAAYRAAPMVPMVFPDRARARGSVCATDASLPPAVAAMVTQLGVRRCDVRASAASFENPDFVDVTIQSYRHRYANAPGDPALEAMELRLRRSPRSTSRRSCCTERPMGRAARDIRASRAALHLALRTPRLPVAGHFLSRETPDAVIKNDIDLR